MARTSEPRPALTIILLVSFLLVVCVPGSNAGAHAGRRNLNQATAMASSNAIAGPGTTAISSNDANAFSTGAPSTAVVQGVADSTGGGQSVVTRCSAYAFNSASYKSCANGQVVSSTNTYKPSSGISFESAPTCVAPLRIDIYHVSDSNCRYWGFENNASCAYKDKQGNPFTLIGSNCSR